MNKTLVISTLSIVIVMLILPFTVNAQDLDATNFEIMLNTEENENIKITETIVYRLNTNVSINTLDFWIQNGANNVDIFVDDIEYSYDKDATKYTINISSLEIKIGEQIIAEITYFLDKNTQNFEKKLLQNTDSITITYDNKILFSGIDNAKESKLIIPIYKTVEISKESPFIYYIIIVILLLIILVIFIYNLRLRKRPKIKETISTTEEVLSTKKSLLMLILKDLEKQYRAKEISDDTYHKIKEQYKQEAVETMKKLDDITKSKV